MFTGIIETTGTIKSISKEENNLHFTINSSFTKQLKVDQSVSHNGVCLTVVEINDNDYVVTAIEETLKKTNLNKLVVGSRVNLERCTKVGDRLDGHIVQGHVDGLAECINILEKGGSWEFTFSGNQQVERLTVNKGSISINGVSLTLVDVDNDKFSVAIIPYTYKNTTFHKIEKGSIVNVEYDIIGKYIAKNLSHN